jgi:hypothetical protein
VGQRLSVLRVSVRECCGVKDYQDAVCVYGLWFMVYDFCDFHGFRFQVSGFRFQVSGLGPPRSHQEAVSFWFLVSGFWFRV